MKNFLGYRCSLCGAEYGPDEVTYTCPKDSGNLDVILDTVRIIREKKPLTNERSLWRYLPLLPVSDPASFGMGTPFRSAGYTPIYRCTGLAEELGLKQLWIKDESRNPSASFKDRASAVVIARAREIGAEIVVTASTGNAGAAQACLAAAVGQKAVILSPHKAPPAKIAQLIVFHATVILVEGSYDQAVELSEQAAAEFGWYCRNSGYNPFTAEGKKTASFEIWEAIRNREIKIDSPLSLFVSVGDGNIISGLHKGFKDLKDLGWLTNIPRLFGVQAQGSAAIARAFSAGKETISPVRADTLADSISVNMPADGVRAMRAARQTGGAYITVRDEQILSAIADLGRAGIFAEPAGAAAYAGLVKAVQDGEIDEGDPVLVLNTGSGLKDIRAARQSVPEAPVIEPTLSALKSYIVKKL